MEREMEREIKFYFYFGVIIIFPITKVVKRAILSPQKMSPLLNELPQCAAFWCWLHSSSGYE